MKERSRIPLPETKQLLFIQEEELLLQQEELGRGIPPPLL